MTKIKNTNAYPFDVTISDLDYVIGSDGDNLGKITRNYNIGDLRRYINSGLSPEVGGTLKVSEVTYNGVLTSPSEVANALDPNYEVLQYHVVIFSVNGNKYILKEQDIILGVSGTEVTDEDFILIIGFTKLGDGTNVLKGYNTSTGLQELYSIKSTGNNISIVSENIVIDPKEGINLGEGQAIYKGLNSGTKVHEFYNLKSSTLNISLNGSDVLLDTPETSTIPALYVNNNYVPTEEEFLAGNTKGEGTLAKPFTDTVTAYTDGVPTITANTAIQNALDAYVGSGTKLSPERVGEQIVIQRNNNGYTFVGDFNYSRLNIKLEENVLSTTSGYIIDMETILSFNQTTDSVSVTIDENKVLQIQGNGFKNNGNIDATNNLVTGKVINTFGLGYIFSTNTDITKYILNADVSETGNNNDGSLFFDIKCNIRAVYQGIYKVGGNARIDVYGVLQSGDLGTAVNTSIKAFHQIGGQVRIFNSATISVGGVTRTNAFTFEPNTLYSTIFSINGASLGCSATTLFNKLNNENVGFTAININAGTSLTVTNIFDSTNLWSINFRNNVFSSGVIDFTKVDLTQGNNISSINTIGNNIIQSLVVYTSKSAAKTAGLPVNSIFLKRVTVNAVDLVAGVEYKIATSGSPSLGTVGDFITATGSETGTGTAYLETIEIL